MPTHVIIKQCDYRKLTTFVLASFASSDLELVRLLKRSSALRHCTLFYYELKPPFMGTRSGEKSNVSAIVGMCED